MDITVIGCGRWGSFIAWYLNLIGHSVSLYGRENSKNMNKFLYDRKNDFLTLPDSIKLSTQIDCVKKSEIIVISINSQGLQSLMDELCKLILMNKIIVLCMKGIEITTGRRLSQIVNDNIDKSNSVAVWLGPGHVQEFYKGNPNCMVIDSVYDTLYNNKNPRDVLNNLFTRSLKKEFYSI